MKKKTMNAIRKKSGLSIADIQERMGIKEATYYSYQNGNRNINIQFIKKFIDCFKLKDEDEHEFKIEHFKKVQWIQIDIRNLSDEDKIELCESVYKYLL